MCSIVKGYGGVSVIAFLVVCSHLLEVIMFMPDLPLFPTTFSKLFWNQSFEHFFSFFFFLKWTYITLWYCTLALIWKYTNIQFGRRAFAISIYSSIFPFQCAHFFIYFKLYHNKFSFNISVLEALALITVSAEVWYYSGTLKVLVYKYKKNKCVLVTSLIQTATEYIEKNAVALWLYG